MADGCAGFLSLQKEVPTLWGGRSGHPKRPSDFCGRGAKMDDASGVPKALGLRVRGQNEGERSALRGVPDTVARWPGLT
jgi:hypothetical protein